MHCICIYKRIALRAKMTYQTKVIVYYVRLIKHTSTVKRVYVYDFVYIFLINTCIIIDMIIERVVHIYFKQTRC